MGRIVGGLALALAGISACAQGVQDGSGLSTFGPPPVADAGDGARDDDDGGSDDSGSGGDDGGTGDDAGSATGPSGDCNDGDVEECYSGPPETANVGSCVAGTATCSGAAWGSCTGEVLPGTESCNGVDDDCNGAVDDALADVGAPCQTGMSGVCADGTSQCSGGVAACEPSISPAAEQCDGLDNDCNGQTDEGNPGGGGACNTGQQGVCSAGTSTCSGGALSCMQNQNPQAEICGNGADEDCNGVADDGCAVGGCVGFCDQLAPDGCYCDAACVGFGDCCPNACAVCGYC